MGEDAVENRVAKSDIAPILIEIEEEGLYLARYASIAAVGRVIRGAVSVGLALDLVGFAPEPKPVVLREIVTDTNLLGRLPCYLLEGDITRQEIHRGQVLASSGFLRPATTFRAEVVFDERYERITHQPFQGVWRNLFHIRHADIYGALHPPAGKRHIDHDDRFTALIELRKHSALEVGLRFGIGRLMGQGAVLEVID